ncbi:MAG: DUF4340 domain-containing protein [Flavipsychrobacter sp.]|nr:DUF4340 domain-containing protein [Flavipsychrobacter sp.]
MKKTLLYLLILAVLAGGAYLVLKEKDGGYAKADSDFNISDTAGIGKVYLAAMNGETILIERDADGWKLNKDYRALQSTVNSLLGTLRQQVGKHPAAGSAHNSIVKSLAGSGVKVEVYDRANKKIREFYVGGETRDYDGSYMLMAGSQTPFVVEIPGFPGYLSPRYTTDFHDWRDRSIFLLKREEISRVSLEYPGEPLNSFVVMQDANGKITTQVDPVVSLNNEMNVKRIEMFLTFFEKVYAEGFATGVDNLPAILDTVPKKAIIDVTDRKGRAHHIDIYWMPVNRRSRNLSQPDEEAPIGLDADRAYGVINGGKDTVVIQYQAFDKIFRKAIEFYQPDRQPQ